VSGIQVLLGMLLLGVATLAFKVVGFLAAGRVALPPRLADAAQLLPTALIGGLVVTQTFDGGLLDAKVLGVAVAAIAVALRAPFALVVLLGAVSAAVLRAFGFA
jgi:uncharacterized membrane protein